MVPLGRLRVPPIDDSWRYAIVGGIVAVLGTSLIYWRTGSGFNVGPVFVGGLLVGYLADGTSADRSRAGVRAGLIGAAPALWMLLETLAFIVGLESPAWFRALQAGVAVAFVGVAFFFAAVVASLGASVGGWLREKIGRGRPTAVVQ